MTQLQELKKQAKEKGFRECSTMNISELQLLLAGKKVPKRLRKNQVSVGTQTDFKPCNECGLLVLTTHIGFKAAAAERRVIYDGDEQKLEKFWGTHLIMREIFIICEDRLEALQDHLLHKYGGGSS